MIGHPGADAGTRQVRGEPPESVSLREQDRKVVQPESAFSSRSNTGFRSKHDQRSLLRSQHSRVGRAFVQL
jgi:hypothetical protein